MASVWERIKNVFTDEFLMRHEALLPPVEFNDAETSKRHEQLLAEAAVHVDRLRSSTARLDHMLMPSFRQEAEERKNLMEEHELVASLLAQRYELYEEMDRNTLLSKPGKEEYAGAIRFIDEAISAMHDRSRPIDMPVNENSLAMVAHLIEPLQERGLRVREPATDEWNKEFYRQRESMPNELTQEELQALTALNSGREEEASEVGVKRLELRGLVTRFTQGPTQIETAGYEKLAELREQQAANGNDGVNTIQTSRWHQGYGSEARYSIGQSTDGFHYSLETASQNSESGGGWSLPHPTREAAQTEARKALAEWQERAENAEMEHEHTEIAKQTHSITADEPQQQQTHRHSM